jgi:glycosyltransferase involved in cell wall biosynthesis
VIPKRLAYLALETPREGQATHTHIHEIAKGLRARGWKVELIATRRGGSSSGSSYLARGLDYVAAQARLLLRLHRVDAVYMRAHFAAFPASIVAALCRKPVVQEINGKPDDILVTYPWLRWIGWLVGWSYRLQMRLASHVIVVTEGLREWAMAQSRHGRVSVVTNGANVTVFNPEGKKPEGEGAYIAFVGGLTAWHGIGVMIAAAQSADWPQDVGLVLIGDGIERGAVSAGADGKRVRWLGRLPQGEAAMWLRGALGALSITQDKSGHLGAGVAPLKLFEAMASGVPVIVTDLPFQRHLVREQDAGLVIPMADPAALARAVAVLAADLAAAGAMGARGADYVRAKASWQARADDTGAILAGVIDARK